MRFLRDGPNFPDELLEARDAGNVVFFCGAGVSQPALPGFFSLTEQVISEFKPPKDSNALALLQQIKNSSAFSPPLDQVFNFLQQEYGAAAIEAAVNTILKKRAKRCETEQHSVILRLSQGASHQPQVVTTNFDRLFERARKGIPWHVQPALPDLGSGQPFEGLVYLHGRMPTQPTDETQRLGFVLSSADFGRAYLADGWATRFVRELLQRYVIVLLGYSATDPPVRYLLEGLHARGDKVPAVIYAFDNGTDDEVHARWRDRGVQPLAYSKSDGSHSALWNSLRAWADRADHPDAWRRSILALAQTRPRDLDDYQRGQVTALVKSDRGAKLFADSVPTPPAEWLCVFDRNVRYGSPRATPGAEDEIAPLSEFGLDDDPLRPARKPWRDGEVGDDLLLSEVRAGTLVRLGSVGGRQLAPLSERLFALGRWVSAVIEEPTTAWWAAGHASLHDMVLNLIEWRLNRPQENIDDRARYIWSLILESYRNSPSGERWFDFVRVLKRVGWTNSTLREFERIATPYLSISRPHSSRPLPPQGSWGELGRAEIVSFEVKFPPEHAENFEVNTEALPAVFRILCRGLEHAAGLLADTEKIYWETTTFHPERKPGEHYLDEADRYLLRVVRFFDRLATEHPESARAEVLQWPAHEDFFFSKLKIYCFMKGDLFSGHECAEGIVALSDDGFWVRHHRRELLHTLRARWGDFSLADRQLVEARILRGPDRWDEKDAEDARRKAMASATVLGWLQANNCKLSSATQRKLRTLRKADARWRPEWDTTADESHEGRSGWVGVNTDASAIVDVPLAQIIPLAEEHTRHPFLEFTEYRPFAGLVKERPFRALSALSLETRHDRYPIPFWIRALSDWPEETSDRLRYLFASRLAHLPNRIVFELRYYLPAWFHANFPKLMKAGYQEYLPLWDAIIDHFFALGAEGNQSSLGDRSVGGKPLIRSRRTCDHSINAPIGKLIEALFVVLADLKLKRRTGIPADIQVRLAHLYDAPGEGADYAVCETTRRLRWLFWLDPKWVEEHVIPFFDLQHPLSEPAWNGLLHTDRLPEPEPFALIKPHFLGAFLHSSSWAWDDSPINRLNDFLVVACYWNVKSHRYISYEEARSALQEATEDGRAHAIWFLTTIVRDLNEWKKFGKPFVQKAWPRERKFQTSASSRNFVHLAEEAGDHFPDVVKTILPFLGPVDHTDMVVHGGTRASDDGTAPLATRFPEPMLALLDRVIPDGLPVPPHDLRLALNMIVAADPVLRQDQKWIRLDAIAG